MYQILQSETSHTLVKEVKQFLEQNPYYKLYYGPYSDGIYHYQAVKEEPAKQLLHD
jgi:hypothetical protein